MRIVSVFIICGFLALPSVLYSAAATEPLDPTVHLSAEPYQKFTSLTIKDVQKLIGRKLTIKEKIAFLIVKHSAKKRVKGSTQGQLALTFGIAAAVMLILALFVPSIIIGALIAGILAVVLGSVAKKQDPSDKKAYAGALLGWITLGAIALLVILAIAIVSSWGWY